MENTNMTLITGNTYPVKDALRSMGGKWDPTRKGWNVPSDKADAARKLVAGATPTPTRQYTPSTGGPRRAGAYVPCGYPGCSPGYCDECDGRGRYSRY